METEKQTIVPKPITMEDLLLLFSQLNTNKTTIEITNQPLHISEKLNHWNYTKRSKLMQLGISRRGRLNHITASPPSTKDSEYTKRGSAWLQCSFLDNREYRLRLTEPVLRLSNCKGTVGWNWDHVWKQPRWVAKFRPYGQSKKIQQGTDQIETYYSKLTTI